MCSMRRNVLRAGAGLSAVSLAPSLRAQNDRYAKFRGQTIVVNYPAHPHYDQAEKYLPNSPKKLASK